MLTVLRVRGYRIGFYMAESDEPAHVHVTKAGCEAKIFLQPLRLAWNKRFRTHDLSEIEEILEAHQQQLIEAWNEYRRHQPASGRPRRPNN